MDEGQRRTMTDPTTVHYLHCHSQAELKIRFRSNGIPFDKPVRIFVLVTINPSVWDERALGFIPGHVAQIKSIKMRNGFWGQIP